MVWRKCTECHHETYREICGWCGATTKPLETEKDTSPNLYEIIKRLRKESK